MSASWSELSHCPAKNTVHRAEQAEQSRVMMMVLGARPVSVAGISVEETASP